MKIRDTRGLVHIYDAQAVAWDRACLRNGVVSVLHDSVIVEIVRDETVPITCLFCLGRAR